MVVAALSPTIRPIGVFDSGVGGLTVARAIWDRCRNESADLRRRRRAFPLRPQARRGDPALRDGDRAIPGRRGVKMLVVACNSIEVSAIGDIAASAEVPVIGVIAPGVRAALRATRNGVDRRDRDRGDDPHRRLSAGRRLRRDPARGRLPALRRIRRARGHDRAASCGRPRQGILHRWKREGVDTVIMGCTHYPLLSGLLAGRARVRRGAGVLGRRDREGCVRRARARPTGSATPRTRRTTPSSPPGTPTPSDPWPSCSSAASSPRSTRSTSTPGAVA